MALAVALRGCTSKLKTAYLHFGRKQFTAKNTFSSTSVMFLERRYTERHEWVTVQDNLATVGITNHAQDALGDIVFAQLPDIGTELAQDEEFGALESVKAASELYAPVSGKVTEKNEQVEDNSSLINSDCYGQGWLIKLEMKKKEEYDSLMNSGAYENFLQGQSQ